MDLSTDFKQIGLNQGEIKVYLYLLEQGLSTPPQIAKGTNITRTNTYHILQRLKEMDLIEAHRERGRKSYIANDPSSLLRILEKKKEVMERILPDLKGIYTTQKNKPKILFYDGIEQIKEIFYSILETKEKKISAIGSTKHFSSLLGEFWEKEWLPEIKKRGIVFYDILSFESAKKNAEEIKNVLKGLHDFRAIPKRYGEISTDIFIWDNHIALINFEDPVFGTVITNKNFAETFRFIYTLLWEYLSE